MADHPDIICPMQRNEKVSPEWCQGAQYAELCKDCMYNNGLLHSEYQREKGKKQ